MLLFRSPRKRGKMVGGVSKVLLMVCSPLSLVGWLLLFAVWTSTYLQDSTSFLSTRPNNDDNNLNNFAAAAAVSASSARIPSSSDAHDSSSSSKPKAFSWKGITNDAMNRHLEENFFALNRVPKPPPIMHELIINNPVQVQERIYPCHNDGLQFIPNVVPNITRDKSLPPITKMTTIPKRIFQTSKSKCVVGALKKSIHNWKQWEDWEYFLYDDQNMEEFFERHSNEFPMLREILQLCVLDNGTLKADLWRYLVLWEYGGLYIDVDCGLLPMNKLTPELLQQENDDAIFLVEQYHLLSQYFIATTPRHPLMWYAVHYALLNVWRHPNIYKINAALTTGPHALHQAYRAFRRDAGVNIPTPQPGRKPVQAGVQLVGSNNRTVTILGRAEDQNEYITRDIFRGNRKEHAYARMNMTHFSEYVSDGGTTANGDNGNSTEPLVTRKCKRALKNQQRRRQKKRHSQTFDQSFG